MCCGTTSLVSSMVPVSFLCASFQLADNMGVSLFLLSPTLCPQKLFYVCC